MDYRFHKIMLLVATFGLLGLSACGKSTGTEEAALTSDTYKYEVLLAGGSSCGLHTFSSFSDFCAALQNGPLNGCCGQTGRVEIFLKNSCPGSFRLSC